MQLDQMALFHQQAFVAGQWCNADNQNTSNIYNPATQEIIGTVPNMGKAEADRAIQAAVSHWAVWKNKTAKDRSTILKKWFELMVAHADELAFILTSEQGKPLAEARGKFSMRPALWNGLPKKPNACMAILFPARIRMPVSWSISSLLVWLRQLRPGIFPRP